MKYYWESFKKYIYAFYSTIDDISIDRFDDSKSIVKTIEVPITYAGKQKVFYVLNQKNSQYNNQVNIQQVYPRIAFMITDVMRDAIRNTSVLNEIDYTDNENQTYKYTYSGNPYDFNIRLSIITKNLDDLFQIIEQIAVKFRPSKNVTVNELPELNIQRDIPVTLNNIALDYQDMLAEEEDRIIAATMDFTLKGWLYLPILEGKLIETINNNYRTMPPEKKLSHYITITEDNIKKIDKP